MSRAEDRLQELAATYRGRRSVAAELVERVTFLAGTVIEQSARDLACQEERYAAQHQAALQATQDAHKAELERVERHLQNERDRNQSSQECIAALTERLSNVRQSQTSVEGGVEVSFAAPLSDRGHARDWTLGELEDIIYRLRVAGADELTKITVRMDHTAAVVPFAELLPVSRPEPAAPEPAPVKHREFLGWAPWPRAGFACLMVLVGSSPLLAYLVIR